MLPFSIWFAQQLKLRAHQPNCQSSRRTIGVVNGGWVGKGEGDDALSFHFSRRESLNQTVNSFQPLFISVFLVLPLSITLLPSPSLLLLSISRKLGAISWHHERTVKPENVVLPDGRVTSD